MSLLAFSVALTFYFGLKVDGKANVFGSDGGGNLGGGAQRSMAAYPHVPGKIILRVKPEYRSACTLGDINVPGLRDRFQELGVTSLRKNFPQAEPIVGDIRNSLGQPLVDLSLIYELECDTAVDIPSACQLLAGHPALMYAEPRYIYETLLTPDDPYIVYQWYLDSMRVRQAWDQTTGDTNVVIAIIDTGTDFGHEELDNEKVAYNWADPIDGFDNDNDGYIDNFKGWDFGGSTYWAPPDNNPNYVGTGPGMDHGVLVAGVAVGQPNNSKGLAGAGFNTRYLPLKASVDQSLGISYGMDAIVYAADHGANILNLSWGSGAFSSYGQNIVNYAAINKGCLLVAASGNQFTNAFIYPACYQNVMGTAATQTMNQAWNNGNGTGTTYNFLVDISAPGRNTITTTGGNSYWSGATGTSMSAPLVCAAAALAKAKYPNLTNIQAGELVRTTARNIDAFNPGIEERIGKGQVDAFAAVTTTNPKSVRFEHLSFVDGNNNIAECFDTLDIVAHFANYLDPTSNLTVTVSSPNSMIEVIQGTAILGAVGTMDTVSNDDALRIYFREHVTKPTKVWLRFGFSDGTYTDYDYAELIVYPNMINMDANKLKTTFNGVGNFGFVDYPGFQYGLGWRYDGHQSVVRDAGFLVGISQSNVVDMTRNNLGLREQDMFPLSKPYRQTGPLADNEARAWFDDSDGGSQSIGINVTQRAYQWADPANDQYIITEYVVKNNNLYPINGAYAGLMAQWNRAYYNCTNANYYPSARAVAAKFDAISSTFFSGMALLSDQGINAYTTLETQFDFSGTAKYDALRNAPTPQPDQTGDVLQFISIGPFSLAPGDSVVVAFALLGASSLQNLDQVSEAARNQYNCVVKNRMPTLDLGTDITVCEQGIYPQINANASSGTSILWSTGDTSASITVNQTGEYVALVTNSYGCTSLDTVKVNFKSIQGFNIVSTNTDYEAGSPVGFVVPDSTSALTSWFWDFGDGNTANSATPSHIYTEAGSYAVTVIIGNGYCSDTLTYAVNVAIATGLSTQMKGTASFFPNPVRDVLKLRLENDFAGELSLEIFDISGRKLKTQALEKSSYLGEWQIEVADLPKGVYFARATFGKNVHTQKITRQ